MHHPPTHPFHKHWPSEAGLRQALGAWTWIEPAFPRKSLNRLKSQPVVANNWTGFPSEVNKDLGDRKMRQLSFAWGVWRSLPPGSRPWTRFCKKERGSAFWEEKSLAALLHENTQAALRAGERSARVSCLERWRETDQTIGHPRIILCRQREPGIITFFPDKRQDRIRFWEETFCWPWDYPCLIVTIF